MKTLGNEVRFAIWFIDLFTERNKTTISQQADRFWPWIWARCV